MEDLRTEVERPPSYEEEIGAPFWLMALLAAALAAMVSAVIAVALDGEADWTLFAWYFPLMAVAGALLVAALLSFRLLHIQVSDDAVRFRFGAFGRSLPLRNVRGCEAQKYRWLTYGGWGIRFALGGRRAWSMPGVPEGVEFTVAEGKRVRRYFVSSRSPELLAEAVRGRRGLPSGTLR